jgi:hypothetical protein
MVTSMNAGLALIREAARRGYTIDVEGMDRHSSAEAAWLDVQAVEEATVRFTDRRGNRVGWAWIVNGLDDDEALADYGSGGWVGEYADRLFDGTA